MSLLDFLAHHPSTARHLAWKLVRRFVADEPPPALVSQAAAAYLANDTAIAPVLRTIFASAEFRASVRAKLRRPFEALMAMLRALGATVEAAPDSGGARSMRQVLEVMGQSLFAWPSPDGYADEASVWLSSYGLLQRWTAAGRVSGNTLDGVRYDPAQLFPGGQPATAGALTDRAALSVLDALPDRGGARQPARRLRQGRRCRHRPAARRGPLRPLVGTLLASPAFQLR